MDCVSQLSVFTALIQVTVECIDLGIDLGIVGIDWLTVFIDIGFSLIKFVLGISDRFLGILLLLGKFFALCLIGLNLSLVLNVLYPLIVVLLPVGFSLGNLLLGNSLTASRASSSASELLGLEIL